MLRLAWFTPLPPSRSGIAAYSTDLLPLLAERYQIDVFTTPAPAGREPAGHPPVFTAHDFAWKHVTAPYDLVVYQLGNATCHDFIWPHLFRYPGLVVLHDAQLHHARARSLLERGRQEDYCAEFHVNHPGAPEDLPRLVIDDLADASYYFWPMLRLVVETARLVAVHAPRLAHDLAGRFDREVATIRMGVPDPRGARADVEPGVDPVIADKARRAACRARHGIAPDAVVLAAFGLVTPEKRISQALHVLPDVARVVPSVQLLLVGETAPHYDVLAEARTLGVDDRITITGYVPDEELPTYLAIADVCLCLRWPTGRETSASWLRALAAGRPTIITDLAHTDEIPSLDPRTWLLQPAGSGDAAAEPSPRAACVSIDILDERHSLGLAMRRLATDAALRDRLGYAARAFWEDHHTLACMVEDYERAIARTLELPVRRPAGLPAHLLEDGTAQVRQMVKALGVRVDFLEEKDAAQG